MVIYLLFWRGHQELKEKYTRVGVKDKSQALELADTYQEERYLKERYPGS